MNDTVKQDIQSVLAMVDVPAGMGEEKQELIQRIAKNRLLSIREELSKEPQPENLMTALNEAVISENFLELKLNMGKVRQEMEMAQPGTDGKRQRLFVDMDGTLAEFKKTEYLEQLYEQGYFLNLKPQQNVIEAVKKIMAENPDKEIYIMSSVLSDSHYALAEKNAWLDRYLPEIDRLHRIFPPCGDNKLDFVPGGIRQTDYLLDDYTANLILWEPPAKGIKLLNGINHTKGTWTGSMLRYDNTGEELAENILVVMEGKSLRENVPQQKEQPKERTPKL